PTAACAAGSDLADRLAASTEFLAWRAGDRNAAGQSRESTNPTATGTDIHAATDRRSHTTCHPNRRLPVADCLRAPAARGRQLPRPRSQLASYVSQGIFKTKRKYRLCWHVTCSNNLKPVGRAVTQS